MMSILCPGRERIPGGGRLAAASFQVATQTVTVKTALAWLGHNYTNQANHPARFAAVLEHKMVTFFKGAGTDVMPPPGGAM